MSETKSIWHITKRLGVNSMAYGFFRTINQVGALLMLPIYWGYLTPRDFGLMAIMSIIAMVLQPVANLGLQSSVERFYFEYDEEYRWKAITKIWLISVMSALIIILSLDQILNYQYTAFFSKGQYSSIRIAVFTIFFISFQYVPFVILRVTERIKEFGIITSLSFLTMSGINIILIVYLDFGVEGYFLGQFANAVIWGGYWVIWMSRKWQFDLSVPIIEELKYSLFQVPVVIVDSISKVVDKFLLEKYIGLADLGVYSIADRFGGFFFQINSSLKAAFFPIIYKSVSLDEQDTKHTLSKVSMVYYLFIIYFALIFSLLSESFIRIFAGEEYYSAISYIPYFVFIYFIKCQETVWGRGADLAKRNDIHMYISVPLLIGSIILSYFLIKSFGIFGAIWALIIASLIRVSVLIVVGHILFKRPFPWKYFTSVTVYCGLIYWGISNIHFGSYWLDFLLRFIAITMFILIYFIAFLKFFDKPKIATVVVS